MKNSKIEWCDHTFNPWWGCTKIASNPCCTFCYAESNDKRWGGNHWGNHAPRLLIQSAWKTLEKFNHMGEQQNRMQRVFTMSMGDLFEVDRPLVHRNGTPVEGQTTDVLRQRLFDEITAGQYPWLQFLVLTKRLPNVPRMVPSSWMGNWPSNVSLGTSVGTQRDADSYIPHLLNIPAKQRFLSMEPLLERIDLGKYIGNMSCEECRVRFFGDRCPSCGRRDMDDEAIGLAETAVVPYPKLHLIIVGGESGRHARPMNPDHVRFIRDQCQSNVPFFFKQWGEWAGSIRVGKKRAGRLLDGREWNEVPL